MVRDTEARIGYRFVSRHLLKHALTHRSYAHERGLSEHNERLELLGDAVIGLVVTQDIFTRHTAMGEGELTQLKSFLVSRRIQARAAKRLGLDRCLFLGASEQKTGVRARVSTLANLFEAIVGALYLDGGLERADDFVRMTVMAHADVPSRLDLKDPKTALQELVQGREPIQPSYHLVEVTGPDHSPTFTVEVLVRGKALARGVGGSKKEAEREAARNALSRLEDDPGDPPAEGVEPSR